MELSYKTRFISDTMRTKVRVPNSKLYTSQLSLQRGYGMRASYEFQNCMAQKGVAYFVTFTFNNNSLLTLGINGVNYNFCNNTSFRLFLVNYLYKKILRKFNCKFRYFCTGELGEGKGTRGVDNNPHFHVIFYLYPVDSSSTLPSESAFFNIIKEYWQGKCNNPQNYRYGIVGGSSKGSSKLDSDAACLYVAKYSMKDICYKSKKALLTAYCMQMFQYYYDSIYNVSDVIEDINLSLPLKSQLKSCQPITYKPYFHRHLYKLQITSTASVDKYLLHLFLTFINSPSFAGDVFENIAWLVKIATDYLSNYLLPKVMLSQGLGLNALDEVEDWTNPKLPYTTAKGVRYFPIPTYLYRKKFYDVIYYKVEDNVEMVSRSHYSINDEYKKIFTFSVFCDKLEKSAHSILQHIIPYQYCSSQNIIDAVARLGIKLSPTYYPLLYSEYFKNLKFTDISYDDILLYCAYYFIYFGRNFDLHLDLSTSKYFLLNKFYNDFLKFLNDEVTFSPVPISHGRFSDTDKYFAPYFYKFELINLLLLYHSYFKNDELFQKNDEWRRVRRAHFALNLQNHP